MTLRLGSLFSGYGGLDMAVQNVLDAEVAWVADVCGPDPANGKDHTDPHSGPCAILAHRHPDVPNLGNVATIDFAEVEPVDIITAGFPCQDLSTAGRRAGLMKGTRSGLWVHVVRAVETIRPQLAVFENVRGILNAEAHSDVEPCPWCLGGTDDQPALRALGAVAADMADIGYDTQWVGLRAADVGASHGRFRVFITAHPRSETV